MGITDKITGRVKKAAGDLMDDPSTRREGAREERKGEAKEELDRAHERADAKAEEVADLERKTYAWKRHVRSPTSSRRRPLRSR